MVATRSGSARRGSTAGKKNDLKESETQCGKCEKELEGDQIQCGICELWYHVTCTDLNPGKFKAIQEFDLHWYCKPCEKASSKILHTLTTLSRDMEKVKTDVDGIQAQITQVEQSIQTKVAEAVTEEMTVQNADLKGKIQAEVITETEDIRLKYEELSTKYESLNTKYEQLDARLTTAPPQQSEAEEDAGTEPWRQVDRSTRRRQEIKEDIDDALAEKFRIEQRKNNLIASQLKEPTSAEDDITKLKIIIRQKLNIKDEIVITETMRLGKKETGKDRLLRFTLQDIKMKKLILSKATTLRQLDNGDEYSDVYIQPDLTPAQVQASKNLKALLKKTREDHEDKYFKIIKGKITEVNANGQIKI